MNTNQDDMPSVTRDTTTNTQNTKKQRKLKQIVISVVVFLLLIAVAGTYIWQRSKESALQTRINDLSKRNNDLNDKLASLQKKYDTQRQVSVNDETAENIDSRQSDLNFSISSVQYVNPDGTVTEKGNWLGVRLVMKNSTSQPINLVVSKIILKDTQENEYSVMGYSGASTLPEGWGSNTIQDRTIDPGESVTGNVIYSLPNKNTKNFMLVNEDKSYSITSSN